MISTPAYALALALAATLAGCGGGGGSAAGAPAPADPVPPVTNPTPPTTPTTPTTPDPVPPVTPDPDPVSPVVLVEQKLNRCLAPRTGLNSSGYAYPDRQGTLDDEREFLRLWTDLTYLWYKEVPRVDATRYSSAPAYFEVLKTPLLTANGQPKDRFHFTYPEERWDALMSGVSLGYGVDWATAASVPPRQWRVAVVDEQPGGLRRGDQLLAIDGEDFVNNGSMAATDRFNAALYPSQPGERHNFTVLRGAAKVTVALTAATSTAATVRFTKVLDTPAGKVGYLYFSEHIGLAESQLIKAFTELKTAGVNDLVLDLRYNGGGLLSIASQLAYMIAGGEQTAGKTFSQLVTNDKLKPQKPTLFQSTAFGHAAPQPARAGDPLPALGLKRVTILAGPGTCSASEAIVNGLRGVGVEVTLVGEQTCGKPYAYTPTSNCGVVYFTIQYQSVNHLGFGDYGDGFAPTCRVSDDFSRALGDPAEAQLAAALRYRATGVCQASAQASAQGARAGGAAPSYVPVRPPAREISIAR